MEISMKRVSRFNTKYRIDWYEFVRYYVYLKKYKIKQN